MAFFKEQLIDVKGFVFDVDGVLASPRVILHPSGDLMRSMNTKDGFAIAEALRKGFFVGIISGARSASIIERFAALGVSDVYLNSVVKIDDLRDFVLTNNLDLSNIVYMGDDLPDLEPMQLCGLATCPSDAVAEVQEIADYVSDLPGGEGCVRDLIEQVLRAQKKWNVK